MDNQVAESAATAMALFSGVKTKSETLGFDAKVERNNVESMATATRVETILKWAQDEGLYTGTQHYIF